ncbi:MAG: lipoyl(octanoyl) transferase LipB [Pseudomonadota bacterium]
MTSDCQDGAEKKPLRCVWLGRVGYQTVFDLQESLRRRILDGDDGDDGCDGCERLLLLEHQPVITLGRRASALHLIVPAEELGRRGIEQCSTNRGGGITYHGPGQLVIYPVVRIARGVAAFLDAVGGAIVGELGERGIAAEWKREPAGIWVGEEKIGACGIHVSHEVAIHGFALNVTDEPLENFRCIVPCGLHGARVTSIARELSGGASRCRSRAPSFSVVAPSPEELARTLGLRICQALGRKPVWSCEQMLARYDGE